MIQLLIYYILIYVTHIVEDLLGPTGHIEGYWWGDYLVLTSMMLFSIMLLTQNITSALINVRYISYALTIIVLLLYVIGWGEDIRYWPVRTTFYLVFGLVVLGLKYPLQPGTPHTRVVVCHALPKK